MMTATEAASAAIDSLNVLGIPYVVVGSFCSNFYGLGRMTQDADFVVHLTEGNFERLRGALTGFRFDPQMSFETATGTSRYVAIAIDGEFKLEFFLLSQDAYDQERFARRRQVQLLGRPAYLLTAEDVVVTKLRWARSKDVADVRDVIEVRGDQLDWVYIEAWCDRHGTRQLLERVRASIPPP
jgi:hypothetical protein